MLTFCHAPMVKIDEAQLEAFSHCLVLLLRRENILHHSANLPTGVARVFYTPYHTEQSFILDIWSSSALFSKLFQTIFWLDKKNLAMRGIKTNQQKNKTSLKIAVVCVCLEKPACFCTHLQENHQERKSFNHRNTSRAQQQRSICAFFGFFYFFTLNYSNWI